MKSAPLSARVSSQIRCCSAWLRQPETGTISAPPVQQDVRMAAVHGGEIDRTAGLEGVLPVHQHQGAGPALLPGKAYGPHASTPSSTSRLTRVWKSRPMAYIMPG